MRKKRGYPFQLLADYFCDYYKITEKTPYEILEIDAKELFIGNRMDLAAKYIYIESVETGLNREFAKELYIKHIEAFTDGTSAEAGNRNKNSIQCYLDEFDKLIIEVKEKGFDPAVSLIPVGGKNELFDGAHRTACAAYFNKKVTVVRFPHLSVCYDYKFFRRRLLDEIYLECMAEKMCNIMEDIKCICIWPSASNKRNLEESKKKLQEANMPIVYSNKMKISYTQFKNIIINVYEEESWVGNKWNNFSGAGKKAKPCFGKGDILAVYLVQCKKVEELTQLKEKLRIGFGLEKHSMHSTDTKEQTIKLMNVLALKGNMGNIKEMPQTRKVNVVKVIGRKLRYLYAILINKIKSVIGKPV